MNTHAAVSFMLLAHCRLTHRRYVNRKLCFDKKVVDLLAHVMSNSACIDEYNDILLGIIHKLHNLVENVLLDVRIISRRDSRQRNLQTLRRDLRTREVDRKCEVNRAGLRTIIV